MQHSVNLCVETPQLAHGMEDQSAQFQPARFRETLCKKDSCATIRVLQAHLSCSHAKPLTKHASSEQPNKYKVLHVCRETGMVRCVDCCGIQDKLMVSHPMLAVH